MITLNQKQRVILSYFRDGKSKRAISREEKLHRKTITKYITEYQDKKALILSNGSTVNNELIEEIIVTPKYDASKRTKRKLTDEILKEVKKYLAQNKIKRNLGQSKQQMKKIDIFEALQKKGYDIGYTTICNLIKKLEVQTKEAFIKQEYNLGEICEFDWGEVKLFINSKLTILQLGVFTSACGNYRYARLYHKQDTLSFQYIHSYFFDHIKGVYKTVVYDNMKVAVKKFVGYTEKKPTDGLLKLSIYYNFNFRFCNIARGNEKGHVERSVEYVRRKSFCNNDNFNTLEDANKHLLDTCKLLNDRPQKYNSNKSASQILDEERPYLMPALPLFECPNITESRVDKYSTVTIDTCHYSVPDIYVNKMILTKKYPEKIVCYFDGKLIASHKRNFGFNDWHLELKHYLKTLKMKPGALNNSKVLSQTLEPIRNIYLSYYKNEPKDFIELLQYKYEKKVSLKRILDAIEKLKSITPKDITTIKIKVLCERKLLNQEGVDKNNLSDIAKKSREQLNKTALLFSGKNTQNWSGDII